jgi:hypothetical protein
MAEEEAAIIGTVTLDCFGAVLLNNTCIIGRGTNIIIIIK